MTRRWLLVPALGPCHPAPAGGKLPPMQLARRERSAIRSALLLALAWIGVAVTSWDAGDGRSWSRLVVLGLGVVLCFAYALGKPRGKAGDEHASIITKSGTAFGIVVVLAWLLFLALRSLP